MGNSKEFSGCYTATITPFHEDGSLALETMQRFIDWQIRKGICGFCPAGTTGEFLYLTEEEKRTLIKATVEAAAGRVKVIAGVWALMPEESARLAKEAERSGADAVFLPPPIYYPASDEVIYQHYLGIRNACSLPVFAYNIPNYASNEITLECLTRLFEAGVIAGVKDSTGKTERMKTLTGRFGSKGIIFAASDSFASEGRRLGANGFISAISNIAPGLMARLWAGEEFLQPEADRIRQTLKRAGSIPALKWILSRMGYSGGSSRLPYSRLSPEQELELEPLVTSLLVSRS